MSAPLLAVEDLRVRFEGLGPPREVVRGVDLELAAGRVLALVGESGCGKSSVALALPRLLPAGARLDARRLELAGRDLLALDERGLCAVRGREIGLLFQDPGAALDPLARVGAQVAEGPRVALGLSRAAARERALALLERVGLPHPAATSERFPHQLSGGQRQRVGLAAALACEPRLLVADEPTTALDVTLQAQVLALLRELVDERGMGLLLVSHDLAVVAQLADEVAVLYAGRVVERAPAAALYRRPRHPYTAALLRARPERAPRGQPLAPIPGRVPAPGALPPGCAFGPRCALARGRCAEEDPGLRSVEGGAPGQRAACHFAEETPAP